jgi:DNA-binding NarL/FixJ family response regulator
MRAKPSHPAKRSKATIYLVDDHPIVRQGLARLINQESDLIVCGEASEASQALDAVTALKPDLTVVDLSLSDTDGIDLIKTLRTRSPHMPVLVLSMHKESLYAERVLRAGAKGYIMKREPPEHVILAIRKVLKGDIYLSEQMSNQLLEQLSSHATRSGAPTMQSLSDRELGIFELIGSGHTTRQIAEALHLSVKTIDSYREHIKEKLHLQNAAQLAQHAFEWVRNGSEN